MVLNGRALRAAAAARFKPDPIRLLLVAEAPPWDEERYFYFEDVAIHDSLFRYVVRMTLGLEPTREGKAELLGKLRDAGVFLIDLCLDPGHPEKSELRRCSPDLVARATTLKPDHIIVIKAPVFDAAFARLKRAGLPVVDARIPFPGSGHQLEFEQAMGEALDSIGWIRPAGSGSGN